MDHLSARGVENAVGLAKSLGLRADSPVVLADGSNLLVHLAPAPVVARVATTTAMVRPDAHEWLARDLSVVRYLHEQGAPVVPPSREADPGPHAYDGYIVSLWDYVEHDRNSVVSVGEAGAMLRELHGVLEHYPGELPFLGPVIDEIPRWLRYLQVNRGLSAADMMMLREAQWRLATALNKPAGKSQALHGDAHIRNLLKTPQGLVWTDFEDVCRGPLAWDIASFARRAPNGIDAGVQAYGAALSGEELAPYLAARELEGVTWLQVVALRFPERRAESDAALERWRATTPI